jgi:hypothetical protein
MTTEPNKKQKIKLLKQLRVIIVLETRLALKAWQKKIRLWLCPMLLLNKQYEMCVNKWNKLLKIINNLEPGKNIYVDENNIIKSYFNLLFIKLQRIYNQINWISTEITIYQQEEH